MVQFEAVLIMYPPLIFPTTPWVELREKDWPKVTQRVSVPKEELELMVS